MDPRFLGITSAVCLALALALGGWLTWSTTHPVRVVWDFEHTTKG